MTIRHRLVKVLKRKFKVKMEMKPEIRFKMKSKMKSIEPKQESDEGSDVDDDDRYDPDRDCHRGRGYCTIEIRRYRPGKWRNVGDF